MTSLCPPQAALCARRGCMEAIVAQLASESEELHQVSGGCGNTVGQEEVEGIPWALPCASCCRP